VRVGDLADAEFADAVDLAVRGAARGPDHAVLAGMCAMYVVDDGQRRGYGYVRPDGRIVTVAATDDETATAVLWSCLAHDSDAERSLDHINGRQQWAVRVAMTARLSLAPAGPVFWRGVAEPPAPYLPDGAYL
jgi:hypothetical protein